MIRKDKYYFSDVINEVRDWYDDEKMPLDFALTLAEMMLNRELNDDELVELKLTLG